MLVKRTLGETKRAWYIYIYGATLDGVIIPAVHGNVNYMDKQWKEINWELLTLTGSIFLSFSLSKDATIRGHGYYLLESRQ